MTSPPPPAAAADWSIGALAEEFGISLRALRLYEERRLLRPRRDGAGRRVYGADDRARLAAILDGARLGLSLREIGERLERGEYGPQGLRLPPCDLRELADALTRRQAEAGAALAVIAERLAQAAPQAAPQAAEAAE